MSAQLEITDVRPRRWCKIDGSWKKSDSISCQRWHSKLDGFDVLLGAENIRKRLTSLHADFEARIWKMKCMIIFRQIEVAFQTDSM